MAQFSGTEIDRRFTKHSLNKEQAADCGRVRSECHALAIVIDYLVPDSREKARALTNLEDAMMNANAGIARRS